MGIIAVFNFTILVGTQSWDIIILTELTYDFSVHSLTYWTIILVYKQNICSKNGTRHSKTLAFFQPSLSLLRIDILWSSEQVSFMSIRNNNATLSFPVLFGGFYIPFSECLKTSESNYKTCLNDFKAFDVCWNVNINKSLLFHSL